MYMYNVHCGCRNARPPQCTAAALRRPQCTYANVDCVTWIALRGLRWKHGAMQVAAANAANTAVLCDPDKQFILNQVLSGEKEIDFENVQRVLEEKSKLVIDVRNPNEFAKGRIHGAHNVPCKFIVNLSI